MTSLTSNNTAWGFWGTMAHSTDPAAAWPMAIAKIAECTGLPETAVRNFLDSRHGRHFAVEAAIAEPPASADEAKAKPQPRANTKQAQLIAMLRRPHGADLDEIAEATGWQKHTIRGAISGTLKKKLGLQVTSDKDHQGRRTYKIA